VVLLAHFLLFPIGLPPTPFSLFSRFALSMRSMGSDGGGSRRRSSRDKFSMKFLCIGFAALILLLFCTGAIGGGGDSNQKKDDPSRCLLSAYRSPASTTELDLKHCKLTELPEAIAKFTALVKLDVSHNSLLALPALPPSLETLFALGNPFETIPPSVAALPRLRMLSFKSCRLRGVGDVPLPTSLAWLILTDNMLTALPDWIGRLTRMRKLMLANNQLSGLPASMAAMRELELLRLANNRLAAIPSWLLQAPTLTWLAIAGNPCVASAPARASLATVKYAELELGPTLGEGTSSVVRRAQWRGVTVAVKEYKAQLSSDGRNLDEVRASCAVDHPHVLRWLGYVEEGASAGEAASAQKASTSRWRLVGVLEWAPGFSSLGKPPSMATITRDTYAPKTAFSAGEIRAIAVGIAEALEHLHARGLAHGDLYAHNILWRRGATAASGAARKHPHHPDDDHEEGGAAAATAAEAAATAKLSDFGAAFYYGGLPAEQRVHFERMEQRAYGFLLEELLERHVGDEPSRVLAPVRAAATAATSTLPEDRPGFAALLRMLTERPTGGGGRGLRPRARFGRVLPDGHPHAHA
jgi:hypothetical protein